MSWNILAGQSVLGVQVVLSPSFLPTGGAEPEERRPWCCARTAQQWPELLCYQHSSSHTQNPGCSEGSYLHPSQTLYIAKCTWKHKGQLLYLNFGEGPHKWHDWKGKNVGIMSLPGFCWRERWGIPVFPDSNRPQNSWNNKSIKQRHTNYWEECSASR